VWTEGVTEEIKLLFHIRRSVDEALVSLYSRSMLIELKLPQNSRDSNRSRQIWDSWLVDVLFHRSALILHFFTVRYL